ncbi:MAG: aminotransferase class I/II-fold pyridoxal phosphate-dependent enzyme, partial [Acidobacteriota bacterium]
DYSRKLEMIWAACRDGGLKPIRPQGAYYLLVDVSGLGLGDDREAAAFLLSDVKVATVPGSSFYADPEAGRQQVRICFAKQDHDMEEACRRIRLLRGQ